MPILEKARRVVVTSWDDSTESDVRLAGLLERYRIKGTFFVITKYVDHMISVNDLISLSEKFEVGSHTISHPSLPGLDQSLLWKEIRGSKENLEKILGHDIDSFAYPYGNYDESVVKVVKAAGYRCARTYDPYEFTQSEDAFSLKVGVWTDPHGLAYSRGLDNTLRLLRLAATSLPANDFISTMVFLRNWVRLAKKLFDLFLERGFVYHLVGHAWQIDKRKEWGNLEDLLSYISDRREVEYMTLGEYSRLVYQTKA